MTVLEQKDDHFHDGLLKLVPPFWGKPRIAALLQTYLNRVQEFEDVCWDVLDRYTLDGADDARLAVLGRIVGQPNFGWGTEAYRAVLRGKIRANRSRGLVLDLLEVIQAVTPTDEQVHEAIHGNATMSLWTDAAIDADTYTALAFLLPKTRAAGVQMHFMWVDDTDGLILGDALDASVGGDLGDTTHPTDGSTLYSVAVL